MNDPIIIRHSRPGDEPAILRLAALDDRAAPEGEALLAFVAGELAAARAVTGGATVADPFRRTADVRALLALRAEQEHAGARAA